MKRYTRYRRRYEVPGQIPLVPADKVCSTCHEAKPVSEYSFNARSRGELNPKCKACVNDHSRNYASQHREQVRAAKKKYRDADLARHKTQQQKWADANREQMRVAHRRWKAEHPDEVRAQNRLYMSKRKARVRAATIVPFTSEQLAQRMSMFVGCWIQGEGCTGVYEHTDHVKPLAAGGAHCLSNLRPSCQRCNDSKGAKWPFERAS